MRVRICKLYLLYEPQTLIISFGGSKLSTSMDNGRPLLRYVIQSRYAMSYFIHVIYFDDSFKLAGVFLMRTLQFILKTIHYCNAKGDSTLVFLEER